MGKSITHKIAKKPQQAQKTGEDQPKGSSEKLKTLQKAKKTSASIKKKGKDKDQQKSDYDELKQLLNLAPPSIDLKMFERGMNMSSENGETKTRKKKLSKKQKGF